ncbi:MAG: DUF3795 domain-containing protein [Spirochaetaceae bacterium]|nr:DUF3795 domain-containing protein [Spirochaetaceae bacterium]
MENKMIAVCGLNCAECGAFTATRDNDDAMRAKVAAEWSKSFNVDIPAESINCGGCRSGSTVLFVHCNECDMRTCAAEKQAPHCGACGDYPCETISAMHRECPSAAENLKAL